jgi:hypothetical protein
MGSFGVSLVSGSWDVIDLDGTKAADLDRRVGKDELLEFGFQLANIQAPFSPKRLTANRSKRCSVSLR